MIEFSKRQEKEITVQQMEDIYAMLKTPYKYGAVIKVDGKMCDSPSVYRYDGKWYMSFIQINNDCTTSGYDSHISESADLLHWDYKGVTLSRSDNQVWDAKQIAAYAAFVENDFEGEFRLLPVNGQYYYSYLGGNLNGYETVPLSIGLCKTSNPCDTKAYEKFPQPILSPKDADARAGERITLYKSYLFIDEAETLGYRYVNVYNAKGAKESIFLSVSKDGEKWERFGEEPIIFDDSVEQNQKINGDAQIIKYKDLYIMLYFIADNKGAYNTFACSYDLIHWKKWLGEPLIKSEYDWENLYAHKPWLVVQNGVVYHFYCAVNDKGERFIALATSQQV